MQDILTIILGGGRGTRLYPLTADRSKPACPFGGKYRLVDIPISNSLNSGFRKIYVLTQFNTASLHLHIGCTYNFDVFSRDYCEILAAEQTLQNKGWYTGTADAVRQNLVHFKVAKPSHYIILSGDQLYNMDLRQFVQHHIDSRAQITIATTPVSRHQADELGILKSGKNSIIKDFLEKPGPDRNIDEYRIPESLSKDNRCYLASMGIYVFDADVMEDILDCDDTDFGKEIIPNAIKSHKVHSYIYDGYWEDIGTIGNFYTANIDLGQNWPQFNLYNQNSPIFTHRRDLPPTKIISSTLHNSLASEGSIINTAKISDSLIGIRSVIKPEVELDGVYVMGADHYETVEQIKENSRASIPDLGIGEGTSIHKAILDKDVRIGKGCRIGVDHKPRKEGDFPRYSYRDGVIIIPKKMVIPDGTII